MTKRTIDLITMGCSKNLVDSERLLRMFEEKGIDFYHNPENTHGDVAVVNTCGFINDAKEESINMILSLCSQKEEGMLRKVYVMGCLSQRYREELQKEIPQVDRFYGKFDWNGLIDEICSEISDDSPSENVSEKKKYKAGKMECGRTLTTPKHYAYLKISEGCDRHCSYCAIPLITGPHVSRPMEEILDEVRSFVAQGVKEFQIIAQELTGYGTDLYHEQKLPELIERIADVEGVEWIRLHYAYPNNFPMDLLRVMQERPNVCKYLDIALQHISDPILKRMLRHTTKQETLDLLKAMREQVPGICIRTTLMVGFPGETDEDFEALMDFVRTTRFDRMGAFAYSEEEGTYAARHFDDDVPEEVKQKRLDRLMRLQERISAELCDEQIGKTFKTIIDRKEGDYYIGRTQYDSPEVDGEMLIKDEGQGLSTGEFYKVTATGADEYDLYGKVVK